MTAFNITKKPHNTRFFAFRQFYRNHRCKPKFDIHSKIQSLLYLKSYFFVLIRFPGRAAAAFCYSASWPCLDFQNHDCIACCMYSHSDLPRKVRTFCDFQWSFFQIQEQQAKFANEVYLLTRFFEKVDSQLLSRLRFPIRQPLKRKDSYKLSQNRIQTILEQLLQLNEAK